MDIDNRERFVHERTLKHMIDALVFLAVQCPYNGCAQNLVHFSPWFFQALQLGGLQQGGEPRMAHPKTLVVSCHFAEMAHKLCCRLIMCLKHA